jgi:hypothetical protein
MVSLKQEEIMKKVLLGVVAIATLAISLYAGVLMSSEIRGTKTYCYYSDGDVQVIDGMGICPSTN